MGQHEGDWRGARFERADMRGARFRDVDLRGARFEHVRLDRVVIRGAEMIDVDIDAEIRNLVVNGVDVVPLVEAELDRRDPERAKMRPTDPDGFREAWAVLERLWDGTVARARRLDPELLHTSVDGEWSFVQTLRHLVFATDAWISRTVLGDPSPWHPLGLPFDQMRPVPGVPWDRDARPTLDEVLELRGDRMAIMRQVLADLTADQLEARTEPVTTPGYPPTDAYPVRECLLCVIGEEWQHRLYAERDLAVLQSRAPREPS